MTTYGGKTTKAFFAVIVAHIGAMGLKDGIYSELLFIGSVPCWSVGRNLVLAVRRRTGVNTFHVLLFRMSYLSLSNFPLYVRPLSVRNHIVMKPQLTKTGNKVILRGPKTHQTSDFLLVTGANFARRNQLYRGDAFRCAHVLSFENMPELTHFMMFSSTTIPVYVIYIYIYIYICTYIIYKHDHRS